jgi:glycosyltransferase involved in cell wall biosynthesis
MFNEMARQLAERNGQVVCFNRPIFILTDLFSNIQRWRKIFESHSIKHGDNITVLRPKLLIHPLVARHIPFIQGCQNNRYWRQVEKSLKSRGLSPHNTVLWLSHPYQIMEMNLPANYRVVYERYDKYEKALGLSPGMAGLVSTLDQELVKRADLVITTASKLTEELNGAKEKTYNLPNSADYEYFSGVGAAEDLNVNLTKGIKKPVIGYLGTIHEGLDTELLLKLAGLKKEWTFLLVGPVQSGKMAETPIFNELKSMPNVILTGWLDWAVLPSYLKLFDVGIIPYRLDYEFNNYVDPNKFHEYMAMGLPIVSTSLPEMSKYKEWVERADDPEAFAGSIEKVLKNNDENKKNKRKNYAQENSWVQRVSKIIYLMDNIE